MGNGKWGTRNGVTDPSNMQEVRHNVNNVIAFLHFNGLIASKRMGITYILFPPCTQQLAISQYSQAKPL